MEHSQVVRSHRGTLAILLTALVVLATSACGDTPSDGSGARSTAALQNVAPLALILDASGSMTTADAPGPRIDAAKVAANELIDALPGGTRFALLAYGTSTGNSQAEMSAGCRDITTLVPLTALDAGSAKQSVRGITPRGYTPIAESLRRAADTLPAAGVASIVLVSDGEDTCGNAPCAVAQELKQARPGLQISTIGFRTDGTASADLQCVANATRGLFVTATNSAQLRARLLATQDGRASHTIVGTSIRGITIGQDYDAIRQLHADFPTRGRKEGDLTLIRWQDCTWVFNATGSLIEIRPGRDTRTVDGIGVGSTVSQAISFYGLPLSDATGSDGIRTLTFSPTGTSGGAGDSDMAYRATVDGTGGSATITTLVLCRCRPHASASSSPRGAPASPATEFRIVKDVVVPTGLERYGPATGYTVQDSGLTVDCYRGGATPHGPSTYQCGSNALALYNCWLKRITGWAWCLNDPAGAQLRRVNVESVNDSSSKDVSADSPAALDLATGQHCILRYGGAATAHPDGGQVPFYICQDSDLIVWTPEGAGIAGFDRSSPQWIASVGTLTGPLSPVAITRAWYAVEAD